MTHRIGHHRTIERARIFIAVTMMMLCGIASMSQAARPTVPLSLHAMFTDHAVVQRDAPIRVYGSAEPGAPVEITLATSKAEARADAAGHWDVTVPAVAVGGPYMLTASTPDGTSVSAHDVMVGDVWLCSGQSNMVLQVHRTLDSRAEIADANDDALRMFTIAETASPTPLATFAKAPQWQATTPGTVADFSAACYYTARELRKTNPLPMGLIVAAWGGSRIEAWMSGAALRATGHADAMDILDLSARDPVAANARWGTVWERWWKSRPDQSRDSMPWSPRDRSTDEWREAPSALGAWEQWGVPELAEFDGMLWYRTTLTLTAAQAKQSVVLAIGAADEIDETWVNGRAVGSAYGAGLLREYPLPRGLLHAGDNLVVINVLDTYKAGGLVGPAQTRALRFADGSSLPLDGHWQYRIVPTALGRPPGAPWQSAQGLSTLWNGMMAPIGRYGVRAIVWYQGESNTGDATDYTRLLRAFRDDWRARFGTSTPLLIAELAGYGPASTRPAESGWAELREAQRRVAKEDAATGLAIAIDIGDRYDIHPANKQELGRRLARAARAVVYAEPLPASGPVATAARVSGDGVDIDFDDVSGALVAYGADGPVGFELCGDAAGSCRYADARIDGHTVRLRASTASSPTRVRYGWADSPVCTLFDTAGLPAGPFELPVTPAPSH